MKKSYLLLLIFLINGFFFQLKSQFRTKVPNSRIVDSIGHNNEMNLFSLFNSNNFTMNHSFSMGMSSLGGFSNSYGTYSNSMNLKLNDKLLLNSMIYFVQPTNFQSYNHTINSNPSIYYNANLKYKLSENILFQFSMSSLPSSSKNGLSPYRNSYIW